MQDYVTIDGNRTQVSGVYSFQLQQGQGPFGGAPDDYSTYGRKVSFFYPPEVLGEHEFECYGTATSDAFDPSSINTTTVTATFTGSIRSGQHCNRTASRSKFAPCMHGGYCAANLLASGEVQRPPRVHLQGSALHSCLEHTCHTR